MSEFDYKTLFDNTGVAICLTDVSGNILLTNRTFDNLFSQYNPKNIVDIAEEGYKTLILKVLEMAGEGYAGVPYPFSFWTQPYNGQKRKYEANIARQPGTDIFIISASDVTKRAEAYEEVNRRNRELTCLVKIHQLTSSSINLDDIVRTTIIESCKIFDFPIGFILMPDSTRTLRVLSYYSHKEFEDGTIHKIEEILNSGRIIEWTKEKYKTIQIQERAKQEITEGELKLFETFDIASLVSVPIVIKAEISGFIIFGRRESTPLYFDQLSILETLAHQLGISINNAILFSTSEQIKQRLLRQNEALRLLHRIGLLYFKNIEFKSFINEIGSDILRITGLDGMTLVYREGDTIQHLHYLKPQNPQRVSGHNSEGHLYLSIESFKGLFSENQVVFIEDISSTTLLDQQLKKPLKDCNIVSLFIAPLRMDSEINGIFSLFSFNNQVSISEEVFSIIKSIHILTESILNNYEYRKMLEQRRVELSRLSKKLIAAQEEEKKRISKDVHDSLGQLAYLLSLNLSTLSKNPELKTNPIFIKTQEIIHQMLEDIRRISYDLRPPTLEEMELVSALRWLIEHSQREGLKINMGVKINSRIEFPYSVQVQIFRIAQEAINNILRHSNATEANIFLYESSDRFYIEITDNGRGFSYDPVQSEGIGLISMKERAESIGGNLKIVSAPNEGTTILLEIKK